MNLGLRSKDLSFFQILVHILTRLLPLRKGFFRFSVKFFGDLRSFPLRLAQNLARRCPIEHLLKHYKCSATRSFAERDRGFCRSSSGCAWIGLRVMIFRHSVSRRVCFTMRSSRLWKLIMPSRPPGCSQRGAFAKNVSIDFSSSFTAIRRA